MKTVVPPKHKILILLTLALYTTVHSSWTEHVKTKFSSHCRNLQARIVSKYHSLDYNSRHTASWNSLTIFDGDKHFDEADHYLFLANIHRNQTMLVSYDAWNAFLEKYRECIAATAKLGITDPGNTIIVTGCDYPFATTGIGFYKDGIPHPLDASYRNALKDVLIFDPSAWEIYDTRLGYVCLVPSNNVRRSSAFLRTDVFEHIPAPEKLLPVRGTSSTGIKEYPWKLFLKKLPRYYDYYKSGPPNKILIFSAEYASVLDKINRLHMCNSPIVVEDRSNCGLCDCGGSLEMVRAKIRKNLLLFMFLVHVFASYKALGTALGSSLLRTAGI